MVAGTVTVSVNRAFGLRDAAWFVNQPVSVLVIVGELYECTESGKGVDPTFPEDSSTFVGSCNDEQVLCFLLKATLPLRGVKQLGSVKVRVSLAAELTRHGPATMTVRNAKGDAEGQLMVKVEFVPAFAN